MLAQGGLSARLTLSAVAIVSSWPKPRRNRIAIRVNGEALFPRPRPVRSPAVLGDRTELLPARKRWW
jgi:hypothetical protein